MAERKIPVIIGVADIVNRSLDVSEAREPARLILEAIEKAIQDSESGDTARVRTNIDSIDVVACWTWPYDDLSTLLADRLQAQPGHRYMPPSHGGNQPAQLLDDAARRVSFGRSKLAVVCGGEALASLTACVKAGQLPPPGWTKTSTSIEAVFSATTRELETGLGKPHRIGAPIQIYPLYENAFRASQGQSIRDNMTESAKLYGDFAKIAEQHQSAWSYGKTAETVESIGSISSNNRMICFPYPLLVNAFNTVNLAAACLVTSTELARELGVPEHKWVFPLGGAGTRDSYEFWQRPNFYSCPSITQSLDAALKISNLSVNDIDAFDFYSCFPIVPKLACHHLGLSTTSSHKPISLLGGLTSFGGAGNNYSMHAVAEMVRRIRQREVQKGLVLANGGWLTYQHVICLSSTPRSDNKYPEANPLPEVTDEEIPTVDAQAEGEAIIETYTVDFDRSGKPSRGHIVGRLRSTGHRFLANHADLHTLAELSSMEREPVGRIGTVKKDTAVEGRNLFSLSTATGSKL